MFAHPQLGGDRMVALSGGDQAQNFELTCRKAVGGGRLDARAMGIDQGKIRLCTELREDALSCFELEQRRLFVSEASAGDPDQHPRACAS